MENTPQLAPLLAIIRDVLNNQGQAECSIEVFHSANESPSPVGTWEDPLKIRVVWRESGQKIRPIVVLCIAETSLEEYFSASEPRRSAFHKQLTTFLRAKLARRNQQRGNQDASDPDYWLFHGAL